MSEIEALIDVAAPVMGLRITPDQRPGVVEFLGIARRMADILAQGDFETADLAPVFTPGQA